MADTIKIAGIEFEVTSPYAEGHVLTEVEAGVLNQTLHENLRNNFAPRVRKVTEEAEKAGTPVDLDALKASFAEYAGTYSFGSKREGSAKVVTDPVEREALRMAKEMVKQAIRAQGLTTKQVGNDKINELATKLVESKPEIKEAAQRRVDEAKNLGIQLDLGSDVTADEQPAAAE